jgi:hypothetical protein
VPSVTGVGTSGPDLNDQSTLGGGVVRIFRARFDNNVACRFYLSYASIGLGARRESPSPTPCAAIRCGRSKARRGAGVRLTDAQTNLRVELVKQ